MSRDFSEFELFFASLDGATLLVLSGHAATMWPTVANSNSHASCKVLKSSLFRDNSKIAWLKRGLAHRAEELISSPKEPEEALAMGTVDEDSDGIPEPVVAPYNVAIFG